MNRVVAAMTVWLALGGQARAAIEHAPGARVLVQTDRCTGLIDAEVARLLDLELAMVTTEIRSGPPLEVQLHCGVERMTITVIDPLTRKRLTRDIPAPAPEPGRERVVALAVSQLFAASWLELLTPTEPPPPPPDDPTPPPDVEAVHAARRVAERSTSPDTEPDPSPPQRELELLVGAGARGRALESQGRLAASRAEFMVRGWLRPSIGLVALVGWDFGQDTRRLGQVRGQAITTGGGLAWGFRPGRVGVGGHVLLAGGWARVRGVPREPGVPATNLDGLTAEASASIGPRLRYGRLRFDLDACFGAMLRSPVGLVDSGAPLSMGGLWAGAVLRLGGTAR